MEARYADLDAVIPHVRKIKPLTEELLPAILAVGSGRVGGVFRALWVIRIELVVLRVHAGRRGIEELLHTCEAPELQTVKIDGGGVVHDNRIMFARKDIAGPTHVSGKLIDLFDSLHNFADYGRIAQVAKDELIGVGFGELVAFYINAADPKAFGLKSFDKMTADETAGAID
jgi:hypothetical protein